MTDSVEFPLSPSNPRGIRFSKKNFMGLDQVLRTCGLANTSVDGIHDVLLQFSAICSSTDEYVLSRASLVEALKALVSNQYLEFITQLAEQLFTSLDRLDRDQVSVSQVTAALALFANGTKSVKLGELWTIFGRDNDGRLSVKNLWSLLRSLVVAILSIESISSATGGTELINEADDVAGEIAAEVQCDTGSAFISFDDFGRWYNNGGCETMSWLELLDLQKWNQFYAKDTFTGKLSAQSNKMSQVQNTTNMKTQSTSRPPVAPTASSVGDAATIPPPPTDESSKGQSAHATAPPVSPQLQAQTLQRNLGAVSDTIDPEPLVSFTLVEDMDSPELEIWSEDISNLQRLLRFTGLHMRTCTDVIDAFEQFDDDGSLSKPAFDSTMRTLISVQGLTSDQRREISIALTSIFYSFDFFEMAEVDTRQLTTGFLFLCRGSKSEKLLAGFSLYLESNDERISRRCLFQFVRACLNMMLTLAHRSVSTMKASELRSFIDESALRVTADSLSSVSNNSDGMTFEEFADWYNAGGFEMIAWLELLDHAKWPSASMTDQLGLFHTPARGISEASTPEEITSSQNVMKHDFINGNAAQMVFELGPGFHPLVFDTRDCTLVLSISEATQLRSMTSQDYMQIYCDLFGDMIQQHQSESHPITVNKTGYDAFIRRLIPGDKLSKEEKQWLSSFFNVLFVLLATRTTDSSGLPASDLRNPYERQVAIDEIGLALSFFLRGSKSDKLILAFGLFCQAGPHMLLHKTVHPDDVVIAETSLYRFFAALLTTLVAVQLSHDKLDYTVRASEITQVSQLTCHEVFKIIASDNNAIQFQEFAEWYNAYGHDTSYWLELMALHKWNVEADEPQPLQPSAWPKELGDANAGHVIARNDSGKNETQWDLSSTAVQPAASTVAASAVDSTIDAKEESAFSFAILNAPMSRDTPAAEEASDLCIYLTFRDCENVKRLLQITNLDSNDVDTIHTLFINAASEGNLTKHAFHKIMRGLVQVNASDPQDTLFASEALDCIFRAFDRTKSHKVSVWEMAAGISTLASGTKSQKLASSWFLFARDDTHSIGTIDIWRYLRSLLAGVVFLKFMNTYKYTDDDTFNRVRDEVDIVAVELSESILSYINRRRTAGEPRIESITFDDFGDWYNHGGHELAPWIELLDLGKWPLGDDTLTSPSQRAARHHMEVEGTLAHKAKPNESTNSDQLVSKHDNSTEKQSNFVSSKLIEQNNDAFDQDEVRFTFPLTLDESQVLRLTRADVNNLARLLHLSGFGDLSSSTVVEVFLTQQTMEAGLDKTTFNHIVRQLVSVTGLSDDNKRFLSVSLNTFFFAFDRFCEDVVDAKEFTLGMLVLTAGSKSEKLALGWEILDDENNGRLSEAEFSSLIRALLTGVLALQGEAQRAAPEETQQLIDYVCDECTRATFTHNMQQGETVYTGISFEEFGEFYNDGGYKQLAWLELLSLAKWGDEIQHLLSTSETLRNNIDSINNEKTEEQDGDSEVGSNINEEGGSESSIDANEERHDKPEQKNELTRQKETGLRKTYDGLKTPSPSRRKHALDQDKTLHSIDDDVSFVDEDVCTFEFGSPVTSVTLKTSSIELFLVSAERSGFTRMNADTLFSEVTSATTIVLHDMNQSMSSVDPADLVEVIRHIVRVSGSQQSTQIQHSAPLDVVLDFFSIWLRFLSRMGIQGVLATQVALVWACKGNKSDKLRACWSLFDETGGATPADVSDILFSLSTSLFYFARKLRIDASKVREWCDTTAENIAKDAATIGFDSFGDWYNSGGYHEAPWIELLDVTKWSRWAEFCTHDESDFHSGNSSDTDDITAANTDTESSNESVNDDHSNSSIHNDKTIHNGNANVKPSSITITGAPSHTLAAFEDKQHRINGDKTGLRSMLNGTWTPSSSTGHEKKLPERWELAHISGNESKQIDQAYAVTDYEEIVDQRSLDSGVQSKDTNITNMVPLTVILSEDTPELDFQAYVERLQQLRDIVNNSDLFKASYTDLLKIIEQVCSDENYVTSADLDRFVEQYCISRNVNVEMIQATRAVLLGIYTALQATLQCGTPSPSLVAASFSVLCDGRKSAKLQTLFTCLTENETVQGNVRQSTFSQAIPVQILSDHLSALLIGILGCCVYVSSNSATDQEVLTNQTSTAYTEWCQTAQHAANVVIESLRKNMDQQNISYDAFGTFYNAGGSQHARWLEYLDPEKWLFSLNSKNSKTYPNLSDENNTENNANSPSQIDAHDVTQTTEKDQQDLVFYLGEKHLRLSIVRKDVTNIGMILLKTCLPRLSAEHIHQLVLRHESPETGGIDKKSVERIIDACIGSKFMENDRTMFGQLINNIYDVLALETDQYNVDSVEFASALSALTAGSKSEKLMTCFTLFDDDNDMQLTDVQMWRFLLSLLVSVSIPMIHGIRVHGTCPKPTDIIVHRDATSSECMLSNDVTDFLMQMSSDIIQNAGDTSHDMISWEQFASWYNSGGSRIAPWLELLDMMKWPFTSSVAHLLRTAAQTCNLDTVSGHERNHQTLSNAAMGSDVHNQKEDNQPKPNAHNIADDDDDDHVGDVCKITEEEQTTDTISDEFDTDSENEKSTDMLLSFPLMYPNTKLNSKDSESTLDVEDQLGYLKFETTQLLFSRNDCEARHRFVRISLFREFSIDMIIRALIDVLRIYNKNSVIQSFDSSTSSAIDIFHTMIQHHNMSMNKTQFNEVIRNLIPAALLTQDEKMFLSYHLNIIFQVLLDVQTYQRILLSAQSIQATSNQEYTTSDYVATVDVVRIFCALIVLCEGSKSEKLNTCFKVIGQHGNTSDKFLLFSNRLTISSLVTIMSSFLAVMASFSDTVVSGNPSIIHSFGATALYAAEYAFQDSDRQQNEYDSLSPASDWNTSSKTISFESFGTWYNERGHTIIPWLELLDDCKWPVESINKSSNQSSNLRSASFSDTHEQSVRDLENKDRIDHLDGKHDGSNIGTINRHTMSNHIANNLEDTDTQRLHESMEIPDTTAYDLYSDDDEEDTAIDFDMNTQSDTNPGDGNNNTNSDDIPLFAFREGDNDELIEFFPRDALTVREYLSSLDTEQIHNAIHTLTTQYEDLISTKENSGDRQIRASVCKAILSEVIARDAINESARSALDTVMSRLIGPLTYLDKALDTVTQSNHSINSKLDVHAYSSASFVSLCDVACALEALAATKKSQKFAAAFHEFARFRYHTQSQNEPNTLPREDLVRFFAVLFLTLLSFNSTVSGIGKSEAVRIAVSFGQRLRDSFAMESNVTFDNVATWYNDIGYRIAPWLELLDFSKWPLKQV